MASKPDPAEAFLAAAPAAHQETLGALHALIRAEAPALAPFVAGAMLGYGKYRYRYASGREGESFTIALASRKTGISLYVAVLDGDQYLPEARKALLGKVKVGRSCINFKKLDDLAMPAVRKLIRDAAKGKPIGASEE